MHAENAKKTSVKQKVAHEFEELAIITLYLTFFFCTLATYRVLLEESQSGPWSPSLRPGRMVVSPFTFYRGSALAMGVDLAGTPSTGVRVHCGGENKG